MWFVDVLAQMGCRVEEQVTRSPFTAAARGVDVDMNDISDTVMTLGRPCVAEGPQPFATSGTSAKETDRICLATEPAACGVKAATTADLITRDRSRAALHAAQRPLHG